MKGYYRADQETAEVMRSGWLHTGDLAIIDEEGDIFLKGRKKRMIITSGFNVYPREIEEALICHRGVREAAVIGVPDAYRGEVLVAYVVADADITQEALMAFLAERLVKYKWPSAIHLVPDLPRTGVGKIDKKQLRRPGTETK